MMFSPRVLGDTMGVISFTKLQHSGETLRTGRRDPVLRPNDDKERLRRACLALFALVASLMAGCRTEVSGQRVDLEHLSFTLPPAWQQMPPSSTMRVAQASVPGPSGSAELVVYYFGAGQGGSIEANLQRWMNQVIPAAGTDTHRETFDSRGLRITWIDAEGTIKPGDMGMGPQSAQPNSRLIAAVIEGEHGPWFFKLTGPTATVTPQRDAFLELLRSAAPR